MPSDSKSTSGVVALADSVSNLLYGIAGWSLVVLALMIAGAGARILLEFETTAMTAVGAAILFVLAFVTAAFGVFANPRFRTRLERRHGLSTFGRVRSVDRRTIQPDEECHEQCVSCQGPVEKGLVRRYREEYALAGIPVYTSSVGYNHYCLGCASSEVFGKPHADTPPEPTTVPPVQCRTDPACCSVRQHRSIVAG
ncbi:hypothetical protein [Natronobacterium gregoryi]|uniref:DUF8108 domain-containing protein n=2 Tax=Natronobacterium gregoryi TaxID=44930 RepID=L0AJK2_NATGS|nr:hypothetical protein [Natronobacterium gregoryi]AFZ73225.1 hypothetical protein Natgr_2042 [Natronobacterium gregoryi SP2]ELY71317.1 hypothetical protein C490_05282 [Natronobacterium gregoryi SP2]PLK21633.1 hypothetical protein CYV19_03480 [Natronobacterium gregoryi SP2]SFI58023.1 hypothetical protein SAMN05443661_10239 [Natronobacterium gregoryi]